MTRSARSAFVRRWAPHAGAAILLAVLIARDRPVYEAIRGFRTPFLDWLTARVEHLRGATFPIVVGLFLMGYGLLRSRTKVWRGGAALLLTTGLSGAVVSVLKPTFASPGPGGTMEPKPGESWIGARYGRFPSSHAAVTFGAATALAAYLPATAPVSYTFAVLVSYERIYHATHFPSDILAGIWIGLVATRLTIGWLARRESWTKDLAPAWRDRLWRRRERGRDRVDSGRAPLDTVPSTSRRATPHQFVSDEEIEKAATGANPEITLVETDEVYRCSVVGRK